MKAVVEEAGTVVGERKTPTTASNTIRRPTFVRKAQRMIGKKFRMSVNAIARVFNFSSHAMPRN